MSCCDLVAMRRQTFCYEFGTYISLQELAPSVKRFDSQKTGHLSYDDFMVWWRANPTYR